MIGNTTKILILIASIYLLYLLNNNQREKFINTRSIMNNEFKQHLNPELNSVKHARMNRFHRIENISFKKPLPHQGEKKCHEVKCPNTLDDDIKCWKCE